MMSTFEWDQEKNQANYVKHGISFEDAQYAFSDKNRIILEDTLHSYFEPRFFCIGKIAEGIVTVRFTRRNNSIRIYGAAFWRKGKKIYEKK